MLKQKDKLIFTFLRSKLLLPGPIMIVWSSMSVHTTSHLDSPPFRWIIHEGLLSVTSESMCTITGFNCLFKLAQEISVVRWTDRPAMTIAVDLGRKAPIQTNKQTSHLGLLSFMQKIMLVLLSLPWNSIKQALKCPFNEHKNVLLTWFYSPGQFIVVRVVRKSR